ncbi:MAG: hypothetical protein HN578_06060 [Rhodospirillales bacterium]|jgi:hypothetical protein|nr:hypothetical protein [Rhodospirillaceae bacterium]MBT7770131.1 hypothetical protein [Rhodospirillales bacterium]MBT8002462.1 hypothetical protein [Rhodospirillales bacterium]
MKKPELRNFGLTKSKIKTYEIIEGAFKVLAFILGAAVFGWVLISYISSFYPDLDRWYEWVGFVMSLLFVGCIGCFAGVIFIGFPAGLISMIWEGYAPNQRYQKALRDYQNLIRREKEAVQFHADQIVASVGKIAASSSGDFAKLSDVDFTSEEIEDAFRKSVEYYQKNAEKLDLLKAAFATMVPCLVSDDIYDKAVMHTYLLDAVAKGDEAAEAAFLAYNAKFDHQREIVLMAERSEECVKLFDKWIAAISNEQAP